MKRKIYLELIITLVVGFLIGFFTNSIITDKHIKEYSLHKGESDFWRRALSEVNVNQEQRDAIRPIIKKHSTEARSILMESWNEMMPIWENMEKEILQELTPEQQEQIKAIQSERKNHFKQRFKEPPHRRNPQRQGIGPQNGQRKYKNRPDRPE